MYKVESARELARGQRPTPLCIDRPRQRKQLTKLSISPPQTSELRITFNDTLLFV